MESLHADRDDTSNSKEVLRLEPVNDLGIAAETDVDLAGSALISEDGVSLGVNETAHGGKMAADCLLFGRISA